MAPAVEVLEGGDEDGAIGQERGRLEAERRFELRHRLSFGLVGLILQRRRALQRRAVRGSEGPLFLERRKRNLDVLEELRPDTALCRVAGD